MEIVIFQKLYFNHNSQHRIKIGNFTIQTKQYWDVKHFSWNQDSIDTVMMGGNLRLKYEKPLHTAHYLVIITEISILKV